MSVYQDAVEIKNRLIKYGLTSENMRKLREEIERYDRQKAFEAGFRKAVEIMQQLEEENFDGTHIEPGILAFEEFEKWEEKHGSSN